MVAAVALLAPAIAIAQTPFDMSPERGDLPPAVTPAPSVTPGPAPSLAPSGPSGFRPFDIDGSDGPGSAPAATAPAALPVNTSVIPNDLTRNQPPDAGGEPPAGTAVAKSDRGVIDRYLLSSTKLRFEGETGWRRWGFSLTAEQAARAATLTLAFNSAIYVSPEDSLLRIIINDRPIIDQALAARENPTHLDTPIPPGTLRPGVNVIAFEVSQRHRTDCTIPSTYELWTEFEADGTGLIFEGSDPTALPVSTIFRR